MIRGKLGSGFEFKLVELFAKVAKNPIWIGDLAEKMLGPEQKKALMEHLRDENGKVRTSAMMQALKEIEDAIPAVKN